MRKSMTMPKSFFRRTLGATLVGALLTTAAPGLPLVAQEAQIAIAAGAYGATRKVEVQLNKSMIVDLPAGVAEVIVSQPDLAAAIMRTRTRAIIQGVRLWFAEGAVDFRSSDAGTIPNMIFVETM